MAKKRRLKPLTQSHYVVTMSGMPDVDFTEFSGIKETSETSKFPDGQSRTMHDLVGMSSREAITLTVSYDPEVHDSLINKYRELKQSGEAVTITVTPTTDDDQVTARGKSFVLNGCRITGITVAEVNRGSTDVSKLSLTFIYDDYIKQ